MSLLHTKDTVLRSSSNYDRCRTMGVMADPLPHPTRSEIQIESVLHALADPVRLRFVRELAKLGCDGAPCGSIELPVTKSTRTHHLRILREAGVINVRPEG